MRGMFSLVSSVGQGDAKRVFIAEREGGFKGDKMDHLLCFVPGMLVLGALNGADDARAREYLELGAQVRGAGDRGEGDGESTGEREGGEREHR